MPRLIKSPLRLARLTPPAFGFPLDSFTLTLTLTHESTGEEALPSPHSPHSLAHSRSRSLTLSRTHSLTHSLTYSLAHSLTHSPTHSLTHQARTLPRTRPLAHSPTHSLTPRLNHSRSECLPAGCAADFTSQKVFMKSFCESQFLHKSVNLSSIIANIKDKLTNLCGN